MNASFSLHLRSGGTGKQASSYADGNNLTLLLLTLKSWLISAVCTTLKEELLQSQDEGKENCTSSQYYGASNAPISPWDWKIWSVGFMMGGFRNWVGGFCEFTPFNAPTLHWKIRLGYGILGHGKEA